MIGCGSVALAYVSDMAVPIVPWGRSSRRHRCQYRQDHVALKQKDKYHCRPVTKSPPSS